jgi:hypothetical protein
MPSIFAFLVWFFFLKTRKNKLMKCFEFAIRVILPLCCIICFILHPVGQNAFLYSFYWFIPVGCYFLQMYVGCFRPVCVALSSTFIAHAVGSLMWLYVLSTTSEYWILLIPRVAGERLFFALGMTLTYYFIKYVFALKLFPIVSYARN